jgi:putative ABC transport system substrate-binding protein
LPLAIFQDSLSKLGYTDGRNIQVELFLLDDINKPLGEVADALVDSRPDVVVAVGNDRAREAKRATEAAGATEAVSIVMASAVDPVEAGLVESLSKPGGNVTGTTTVSAELAAKRVEILGKVVPNLSKVAVMVTPRWAIPGSPIELQWRGVEEASRTLGIEILQVEIQAQGRNPQTMAALESAISGAAARGAGALFPLSDAVFDQLNQEIAHAAFRNSLPSVYRRADYPERGGLMSYGQNSDDQFRRVAEYVDEIVKGAKPRDLPVSLPTLFDLGVNLCTASHLGVTFPDSILEQATDVFRMVPQPFVDETTPLASGCTP